MRGCFQGNGLGRRVGLCLETMVVIVARCGAIVVVVVVVVHLLIFCPFSAVFKLASYFCCAQSGSNEERCYHCLTGPGPPGSEGQGDG